MTLRTLSWAGLAAAAVLLAGCSSSAGEVTTNTPQPAVFRFAVMGDTALKSPDEVYYPSACNVPQLTRTVLDLASISPPPSMTFLMGDLVTNEVNDQGQALTTQLDAWQAAYSSMSGSGAFELVPYVGNHESQVNDKALGIAYTNPFIYPVWRKWLAQTGYGARAGSGPTPAGDPEDFLVEDERDFSYSFTVRGVRFIVVNTDTLTSIVDPTTAKPYAGWIPLHWVEGELARAQADPLVTDIFVTGHRILEDPSFAEPGSSPPVLNNAEYPLATRLESAMKACPKVRAYLCSHVHADDMMRLSGGTGVWQIVSGNAGAPLKDTWNPTGGPHFGFMVVNVYGRGRVGVVNYRRPVPPGSQKYYEDKPVPPPAAVPDPEVYLY